MSARAVDMQSARFWAHAATFGALWGAIEATVGAFVHAVKVPFGGTALAATGAALLLALRVVYPRPGVIVAAGAVCACVKMVAPSTLVLGPMVGIMVESCLVEIACLPLGAKSGSAIVGGACATFWALTQKVLTQVILYGAPVITLYKELLARGEAWLNLPKNAGIAAVVVFAAVVGCLGAVIALVGLRAGQVAMERRARTEEALA
jgi:hypothetical protein